MVDRDRLCFLLALLVVLGLSSVLLGCAGGGGGPDAVQGHGEGDRSPNQLDTKNAEAALRLLPYRYKFRSVPRPDGDIVALRGRAIGEHHTVVPFGVILGDSSDELLPSPGAAETYRYPQGRFSFTTDIVLVDSTGRLEANSRYHSAAQWEEANRMEVRMTERLCQASTGEHCPF